MCFTPEISVEQSRFGYGREFEKARDKTRGGKPSGRHTLDPTGPVKRTTISLPPEYWNMIPEGVNRSQWLRSAVLSSVSQPFIRTNYDRRTFQNGAHSIVIDSSLSPSQRTSCLTHLVEAFIVSGPI